MPDVVDTWLGLYRRQDSDNIRDTTEISMICGVSVESSWHRDQVEVAGGPVEISSASAFSPTTKKRHSDESGRRDLRLSGEVRRGECPVARGQ